MAGGDWVGRGSRGAGRSSVFPRKTALVSCFPRGYVRSHRGLSLDEIDNYGSMFSLSSLAVFSKRAAADFYSSSVFFFQVGLDLQLGEIDEVANAK